MTTTSTFHEVSVTGTEKWSVSSSVFFGGRSGGRTLPKTMTVTLTSYRYRGATSSAGRFVPRVCVSANGISLKTSRIVDVLAAAQGGGGPSAMFGAAVRTVDSGASWSDTAGADLTFTIDLKELGDNGVPSEVLVWVEDGGIDPEVMNVDEDDTLVTTPSSVSFPTATASATALLHSVSAALSQSPPDDGSLFNALPCRINLPIYKRTTDIKPYFNTNLSQKIDLWFIGPEAATGDKFPDQFDPQSAPVPFGGLATGGVAYVAFYGGSGSSVISDSHFKGSSFSAFVHLTTPGGIPDPQRKTGTVRFDYIVGDEITTDSTFVFPPEFVAKREMFTIHKIFVLPRTQTFEIAAPFVPPLFAAIGHPVETPIGEAYLIPLNLSSYRTLTGTLQITLAD